MILALSPPSTSDFGHPTHAREAFPPYDYNLPKSAPPVHHHYQRHEAPTASSSDSYAMSTSHRGLPPPSAMALPDPTPRPLHPQHLGSMPAPPSQWHGAEESMRNWLATKAEEERRKQEEERTRQESLRLEQRRVEHSILRDSMQGGIPPPIIPLIFAGIGGHVLANASAEWLQQYTTQLQESMAYAPERRDTVHSGLHPVQPPSHPTPSAFPAYTAVPGPAPPSAGPTSAPRSAGPGPGPGSSGLSRLNTVDLNPSPAPAPAVQEQQTTSPSVQFHHWMPPATQETKGHLPPTPNCKEHSSILHGPSESEYQSPRKRKATGGHQPNPGPMQISPSLIHQANHRRSQQQTHVRTRSNKSDERSESARRDSVAASTRSTEEHRFSRDAGWLGQGQGQGQTPRLRQGNSPRRDTR